MRRLICVFVVCIWHKQVFSSCGSVLLINRKANSVDSDQTAPSTLIAQICPSKNLGLLLPYTLSDSLGRFKLYTPMLLDESLQHVQVIMSIAVWISLTSTHDLSPCTGNLLPGPEAQPDVSPTGIHEVADSILWSSNILSWRLVTKSCLQPFFPYRWFK